MPSAKMFLALILAGLHFASPAPVLQVASPAPDPQQLAIAYERTCVSSLRTLNTAQLTHRGADWDKGYAETIEELGPKGEDLIEPILASGEKNGYRFILIPEKADDGVSILHYRIVARPIKLLVKGQSSFFTDDTGIIRFTKDDRAATVSDPPVT